MRAVDALHLFRQRGIWLRLEGTTLRAVGPPGAFDGEMQRLARKHREGLLELVAGRACGECGGASTVILVMEGPLHEEEERYVCAGCWKEDAA